MIESCLRGGKTKEEVSHFWTWTRVVNFVFPFTCSDNPLEIPLERLGKVLLHSQLSERFPPLHSRPLITELSAREEVIGGGGIEREKKQILIVSK